MPKYLSWAEKKLDESTPETIDREYNNGFVFTRIDKGIMQQTRSLRIDLAGFKFSSENKRILKKVENISVTCHPIPYMNYDYTIGKLAKDFYTQKFGEGTMSAQKIKELLTDKSKSNFNHVLVYSDTTTGMNIGYSIIYRDENILHYSYPFYNLTNSPNNIGMGMMIKAIEYAISQNIKYIYLGSLQRPSDVYKLQFNNTEWFNSQNWSQDFTSVKDILK
jgi:arginyl-tRNA--protein-N-Asp/Glu arginylyltransferase